METIFTLHSKIVYGMAQAFNTSDKEERLTIRTNCVHHKKRGLLDDESNPQ